MKRFGERLRDWREQAAGGKISQRRLDLAIEKNATSYYTAQVESGKINPPDRATCDIIAGALGLEPEEVWRFAAPERLRALHGKPGDLADWHDQVVRQARESDLSGAEDRLIAEVRRLGDGAAAALALALGEVVAHQDAERAWSAPRAIEAAMRVRSDQAVQELFRRLHRLHPTDQATAWGVFAGAVHTLWNAKRDAVTSEVEGSADGRDEDLVDVPRG